MGHESKRKQGRPPASTGAPSPGNPRLGTIAGEWLNYAKFVIPAGAPAVQLQESRRAFYAGAVAMFKLMNDITDSVPDSDAGYDLGAERLEKLNQEIREYVQAMKNGRA